MKFTTEHVLTCFVRGLVYCDLDLTKLKLKRGDQLTLVPEPNNEHDSEAIAIYHGKTKLGYIPRDQTGEVHDLVNTYNSEVAFRCVVKQFAPSNATHRMILVDITARIPEAIPQLSGRPLPVY